MCSPFALGSRLLVTFVSDPGQSEAPPLLDAELMARLLAEHEARETAR
jgi:hypothetical protein